MKGTFSITSLVITISAIFLLAASYQTSEANLYLSEDSLTPLLYPRILLFTLICLGCIVFARDFLRGVRKQSLSPSIYIFATNLIAYYYLYTHLKFYISTAYLCASIVLTVDRKFALRSTLLIFLLPLGTWILFNYGLDLQIQFI